MHWKIFKCSNDITLFATCDCKGGNNIGRVAGSDDNAFKCSMKLHSFQIENL